MPVFENWGRTVRSHPGARVSPRNEDVLREAIVETRKRGGHLRVVGGAHSFTPLAASEDLWVSLDALAGVLNVDPAAQRVRVRGGTRLSELGSALASRDLALANMGDVDVQSVAGAICTATHGTGRALGSLSTQVTALRLVDGRGEVLQCSAESHPELFQAARISLGTLGAITEVELAVQPAYRLWERRARAPLEETLADIEALTRSNRHFELFWFPYSDLCSTKTLNPTDAPAAPHPLRDFFVGAVLENAGLWMFSELCRWLPLLCHPLTRVMTHLMSEGQRIDHSHRVFATPRHVRFAEMEYAVPAAQGPDCLRELRAFVRDQRVAVGFPIEYRYVAADDLWLSPFYQRESAVIAVHMYAPMPRERYFDGCEAIFRNHAGRPHWGKLHGLRGDALRALYPRFDDFLRMRETLDPDGVFLTPYLRELLGLSALQ